MRIIELLSLLAIAGTAGFPLSAKAQEKEVWSDINCSQSKLVTPAGLRCRSTQIYAGGSRIASGSGPNGLSQDWATIGRLDGSKLYYFGKEAMAERSSIFPYVLTDAIKSLSPQGRGAKNMSESMKMGTSDYIRFVSESGEACVGIKKEGPARRQGFQWIVIASKCAAKGKSISDEEIDRFMASTDFRA
jgi:hypothetical protein